MKFKRGIFVLLISFVTILLSGCSLLNSDSSLFKETFRNMEKSYNYELKMTMDLKMTGLSQNVDTIIQVDLENKKYGKIFLKQELLDMDMYVDLKFDDITLYYSIADHWFQSYITKSDLEDLGATLSTEDYDFLAEDVEYEFIEDKTIYGVNCKVYEFKGVNEDILTAALGESKEDVLDQFNITENEYKHIFEDLIYRVTIDKDNKLIKKIEIDLKPVFENIDEDSTYFKFIITMEFRNYNEVEVTIPDEALHGTLIDFDL